MEQAGTHTIPHDTNASDDVFIAPDTVGEKLNDILTPTYQAEFDPEEAEAAGAFSEEALSAGDAVSSAHDSAHFVPHLLPPKA